MGLSIWNMVYRYGIWYTDMVIYRTRIKFPASRGQWLWYTLGGSSYINGSGWNEMEEWCKPLPPTSTSMGLSSGVMPPPSPSVASRASAAAAAAARPASKASAAAAALMAVVLFLALATATAAAASAASAASEAATASAEGRT